MNRYQMYNTILATMLSLHKNLNKTSIDIYIGFGNKQSTEIHPPLTTNLSNRSNDRCMLRSGNRETEIHPAPIINRNQSESGKQDQRNTALCIHHASNCV